MSLAICRCCLNKDINENKLINMAETFLFEENQSFNANILINFAYLNFSGIDLMFTESDLKICISCRTLLQTSYNFRELCRESHEVLVNAQIKTEPVEAGNELPYDETKIDILEPKVSIEPVKSEKVKESKKKSKRPKRQYDSEDEPENERIDKSIILPNSKEPLQIDFIEANFMCNFCDRKCKNYAMLILHRKCHNYQSFTRQCFMCGEENLADFESHIENMHPNYRPQQCLICNTNYVNHKELKAHLKKHLPPAKYQCMGCGKMNKTQYALRSHIIRNCGKPNLAKKAYNCHVCGLKFNKIALLNSHVFSDHPKEFTSHFYPCYNCKKIYSSQMGYKAGCKTCPGEGKVKQLPADGKCPALLDCPECDEKLFDQEDLECHHIRNHQLPGCYCFDCDKGMLNVNEFRRHKHEYHSKRPNYRKEKRHMCAECGKRFNSPYHLRDHALYHSNDNLVIKCTLCSASFRAEYHLKRHMKQSHNRTFSYECNECGKRVDSKNYLKIHFARAHFPSLRKYHCDACPRSFASITDKKRHMVTHTGDRAALGAIKPKPDPQMALNLAGRNCKHEPELNLPSTVAFGRSTNSQMALNLAGGRLKQEPELHVPPTAAFDSFFNQHPTIQNHASWSADAYQ